MNEEEIEEVIEWCDILIDRTFIVRDKFFNLPTGMIIPVNIIRTIRSIHLKEHEMGANVVFEFDVIGMAEPLVSSTPIPKFPSYYNWGAMLMSTPPMCYGLDENETKSKMEEYERGQDEIKKTEREAKLEYIRAAKILIPIVEDTLHDLKNHMVELWAPLYK